MFNSNTIGRIIEIFSYIETTLKQKNKLHLFDANTHAENFVCTLLNMVYGWNLENLNVIEYMNYPGLDLGSRTQENSPRIGIQVTATISKKKITHTFEKVITHQVNQKYSDIYFFILGTKDKDYQIDMSKYQDIHFDAVHVIDFPTIENVIMTLDYTRQNDILVFLCETVGISVPESEKSFSAIINRIPEKAENEKNFNYLNSRMKKIYGREEELKFLKRFLMDGDDNSIRYCVITGPGGIGKSKLVYHFVKSKATDEEWKMVYASKTILKEFVSTKKYHYCKNLLLVIDYADASIDLLREFFKNALFTWEKNRLRLILIEREGLKCARRDYRGKRKSADARIPEWYKDLISTKHDNMTDEIDIEKIHYKEAGNYFLELGGLKKEYYSELIDEYSREYNNGKLLEVPVKDQIISFCNQQFHNLQSRPLFILFTTDAVINGESVADWNIEQALDYVYKRDWEEWERRIPDKELLNNLVIMLVYSTIFKEWEFGTIPFEELSDVCKNIQVKRNGADDPAESWAKILSESTVSIQGTFLKALEPDLVGEYFVIKQIKKWSEDDRNIWATHMASDIEVSGAFLSRCIQDYSNGVYDILKKVIEMAIKHLDESKNPEDTIHACQLLINKFIREAYDEEPKQEFIDMYQKLPSILSITSEIIIYQLINNLPREMGDDFICSFIKCFYDQNPNNVWIAEKLLDVINQRIFHNYKSGQLSRLLTEKDELIYDIQAEDIAVKYMLGDTKFIRKIINRYVNDSAYKPLLDATIEKHFDHISHWYNKYKYTQKKAEKIRASENQVKSSHDVEIWYQFIWEIPTMLIPIVDSLYRYDISAKGEEIFEKYRDFTVNELKHDGYPALWHFKTYVGNKLIYSAFNHEVYEWLNNLK